MLFFLVMVAPLTSTVAGALELPEMDWVFAAPVGAAFQEQLYGWLLGGRWHR